MGQTKVADSKKDGTKYYVENEEPSIAADPIVQYMPKPELEKLIKQTQKAMEKAAKELDFIDAARLRDELSDLKKLYEK
jgi:excinuclease ABC subunit B